MANQTKDHLMRKAAMLLAGLSASSVPLMGVARREPGSHIFTVMRPSHEIDGHDE